MIEKMPIDLDSIEEIAAWMALEDEELQGQFMQKRDANPEEQLFFVVESPRLRRYWRVLTQEEIDEEYFRFNAKEIRRKDAPKVEWRKIKEFPSYQINIDGDVRNASTGRLVTEQYNPYTGAYYYDLHRNAKRFIRNYKSLLYKAFPELLEGWVDIPGFPFYRINRYGQIMGMKNYNRFEMSPNGSYVLRTGGIRKTFRLDEFDWTVFENYEEIPWYKLSIEKIWWRQIPIWPSHEMNQHGQIRKRGAGNFSVERHVLQKAWFPSKPDEIYVKFKDHNNKAVYFLVEDIKKATWPEPENTEEAA